MQNDRSISVEFYHGFGAVTQRVVAALRDRLKIDRHSLAMALADAHASKRSDQPPAKKRVSYADYEEWFEKHIQALREGLPFEGLRQAPA